MGDDDDEEGWHLFYSTLVLWILPSLCISGLLLNLLCAALFWAIGHRRKHKIREVNAMRIFLIALSLFDAVQLLLSIFVIVIPKMEVLLHERPNKDEKLLRHLHVIGAYSLRFCYPILMAANYASIWTITAIAAIRYAAVCHPLASRHRFPILRRHRTIVVLITILSVVVNLPRFFEFVFVAPSSPELVVDVNLTELRRTKTYIVLNDGILYPSLVYLLPLAVLASLYAHIFSVIHAVPKSNAGPRLSAASVVSWASGGSAWRRESEEHWRTRAAQMVATIVVLFFFCNTLSVGLRWWELADPSLTTADPKSFLYKLLTEISNFLVNLNSAANPFVYFFFTRMFRDLASEFRKATHKAPKALPPVRVPLVRRSDSE